MSTPIYAPDDDLFPSVMRFLVFKQQMEAQRENQKIRQAELKIRQQEQEQKAAQEAQAQMPALLNFIQAAQDPSMGQLTQMPLGLLGNAQVSTPTAMGAVNAVAAPQQIGGRALPSKIDQIREERRTEALMSDMKKSLTPEEFTRFNAAVGLVQQGVPKEMLDFAIPETLKEAAERTKILAEAKGMETKQESDAYAQQYLAQTYGINVGTDDANRMLQNLVLADRAAAQARSLEAMKQKNELPKIEEQLRTNFEASPVVKQSQSMASSFGRIAASAARKTGPADQALIFAFVNMQDQTAARDSERAAIQAAGSLENYITARFGRWKSGEVLADEVRQKVVQAAEDLLNSQRGSLDAYMNHYKKIAEGSGIDPSRIMYDPLAEPMQKAKTEANRIRLQNIKAGQ